MRWQMFKKSIYAAIAVTSVLIAHNAIVDAKLFEEPIVVTSTSLRASDTINAASINTSNTVDIVTKFIEISPIESTVAATGDTELNAVEVSSISDLSGINTMLTESNLKYVAQIFESEPDVLEAGTYQAELFENDRPKRILFFKQAVANPEMIEGVIAVWDIGNDIPTNAIYTVKITKSPINAQDGETTG